MPLLRTAKRGGDPGDQHAVALGFRADRGILGESKGKHGRREPEGQSRIQQVEMSHDNEEGTGGQQA